MTTEWLQNLKAGEQVIVDCGRNQRIMTVERVKPRRIKINGIPVEFRKINGDEICKQNIWSSGRRLQEPTPEAIQKIRESEKHSALLFDMTRIVFKKLSINQLERIVDIAHEEPKL